MSDEPAIPLTIEAAAAALRGGKLTSVALTEATLARAERHDRQIGSFIARFDDTALARARHADAELAAGIDLGPLHGIPIAVKDILAAKEGPTTAQSVVIDPDWVPARTFLSWRDCVRGAPSSSARRRRWSSRSAYPRPTSRSPSRSIRGTRSAGRAARARGAGAASRRGSSSARSAPTPPAASEAAPFAEATLLRAGRAYQQEADWHQRSPDLEVVHG